MRAAGLEPTWATWFKGRCPLAPKASASTDFATPAKVKPPRESPTKRILGGYFHLQRGGDRAKIRTMPLGVREYIADSFRKGCRSVQSSPQFQTFLGVSELRAAFTSTLLGLLNELIRHYALNFFLRRKLCPQVWRADHSSHLSRRDAKLLRYRSHRPRFSERGKLQAGIPIEGKRVRLNRETGEITVEHAVLEPREKTTKP